MIYTCLGNTESTFSRMKLKSDCLRMPVNLVQYWGAVGNFKPYSEWAFLGLITDEGGGQKGPPSLKSVTHILLWRNLAQLYLTWKSSKKYINHVSAEMATPGLLKITLFWNKCYDVIISFHDVTSKILSRDSNYIVDVVMWRKFGNSNISMREVIIIWILEGFNQKNHFFWGVVLVQVQ